jgi:hypothetical protein
MTQKSNVTANPFVDAKKYEAKLRLALTGPSGAGKTWTALKLATEIARLQGVTPNIFVIDTEHGSAAKYSADFEFMTVNIGPTSGNKWDDYHPRNALELFDLAGKNGCNFLILDSLTHFWSGTGGVLDIVEDTAQASRSKNRFAAWRKGTEWHNALIEAIIGAPFHFIATMRSKTEYVQEGGKVTKVGMAAIQRDGMEYEFDIVLGMTQDHNAIIDKSRASTLDERAVWREPGEEVAQVITDWLGGKKDPYQYNNGVIAPHNAVTRRLFSEYVEEHKGEKPDDADALKAWYATTDEAKARKEEAEAIAEAEAKQQD